MWHEQSAVWKHDIALLSSGAILGFATSVRSNGLASGIIYLYAVCIDMIEILENGLNIKRVRKIAVTVLGGILVAAGSVIPQYLAYQDYCYDTTAADGLRCWCKQFPPSIYNFVQSYYW